MKSVFADAFFHIALLNPRDAGHPAALRFATDRQSRFITTGFVLIEVADALCLPKWRPQVLSLLNHLSEDPCTQVIEPSRESFASGYELYANRGDKAWSLTDCISFAIMEKLGLQEALTADIHFEQAGFRRLLDITQ